MAINFYEIFQNLGLTQSETKTYFANHQLGPSSIQQIAKKAKLSRTAVYDAVASLQKQGLLSNSKKGKKKLFVAEEPDRVISYFKTRLKDMEGQVAILEKSQDELALLGGGERPTVRFFEGEESMRALFMDISLSKARVIREISNMDHVYAWKDLELFKKERDTYLKGKKIETRIVHRGTLGEGSKSSVLWTEMAPGAKSFKGDIWIYGDHIAFITLEEKMVLVIIENKVLAQTMRVVFDQLEAALRLQNE